MFGGNRTELRQMYADAWRKSCASEILTPLEAQIATVVDEHPEYHAALDADNLETPFGPDEGQTNPFLHMGLHLALREQVSTDRPAGIAAIHRTLARKHSDHHAAEHQMLEALAETLWEAQSANCAPDENKYIERLRELS
jgi:hypothetical protein